MNASESVHRETLNKHPPEVHGFVPLRAWRWLKSPYAFLDHWAQELGPTFSMSLPGMGRVLVTGDAELISATAHNKALVGGRGTRALRPVIGEHSLIVLEGKRHRQHRRSIAPSLSADAASQFDEMTLQVCRETISSLQVGAVVSVQELTRAISLRLIIRVLFGSMGAEREDRLIVLVEKLMSSFAQPAILFIRAFHWNLGRMSPWGRFLHNKAALCAFIVEQLAERRVRPEPGDALLDRLIAQQQSGEFEDSDEAIIEELISLLLFGHDTAAATMAWLFHHVHQDADTLQQLRAEALGTDVPSELFGACIRESQRLCPVVVHVTRVAVAATRVGDYALRAGDSVLPCMYLAQRNPDYFAEPERFLPQRFMQQSRAPAWSTFPFGFGTRKCVGATFAKRQMKLMLLAFMRHTRLEPTGATVRPVREMLLIVPSGGTMMRLREKVL